MTFTRDASLQRHEATGRPGAETLWVGRPPPVTVEDVTDGGVTDSAATALRTDHYELTMVASALESGVAGRGSVFEVFSRRLPAGRAYGVIAGMNRVIDAIEHFRFTDPAIEHLVGAGVVADGPMTEWLANYRFSGDVTGYADGELYFPYSPVLTVEGSFAECVVLETVLLSVLNHDCAIASAAARVTDVANGRTLIDGGSRRTDPDAAIASARSAASLSCSAFATAAASCSAVTAASAAVSPVNDSRSSSSAVVASDGSSAAAGSTGSA